MTEDQIKAFRQYLDSKNLSIVWMDHWDWHEMDDVQISKYLSGFNWPQKE